MTLNGIEKLSRDEARSFATQEVDPLDEELGTQPSATPAKPARTSKPAKPSPVQASADRSEAHTSEVQSLMRNSYAVFCLTKQTTAIIMFSINSHPSMMKPADRMSNEQT